MVLVERWLKVRAFVEVIIDTSHDPTISILNDQMGAAITHNWTQTESFYNFQKCLALFNRIPDEFLGIS